MKIKIIPFDSPEVSSEVVTVYEVHQVPQRGDLIKWMHDLDEHDERDCTLRMRGTVDKVYWDFIEDEIEVYVTDIEFEEKPE